jgi:hypothetical protein
MLGAKCFGRYAPWRTLILVRKCYGARVNRPQEESTMPSQNEKLPDQAQIVASLAAECHVPVGDMALLYEHERMALAQGAHLTKFLHIFAIRNVLEILRKRDLAKEVWQPTSPALRPT